MSINTGGNINVSGFGNVVDLNVTGPAQFTSDISVAANVYAGNVLTDNYFYANGTPFVPGGNYGDANVEALLASGTITTDIITTANVSANNVNGNSVVFSDGTIQTTAYIPSVGQLGYFTEMPPVDNADVTGETSVTDDQNNQYVSTYWHSNNLGENISIVTKFNPAGAKVWSKEIVFNGTNINVVSMTYGDLAGDKVLTVMGRYYDFTGNRDFSFVTILDPATGNSYASGNFDNVFDISGGGVYLYDGVFDIESSNPTFTGAGYTYGEVLNYTMTPIAGSTTNSAYVTWTDWNNAGISQGSYFSFIDPNTSTEYTSYGTALQYNGSAYVDGSGQSGPSMAFEVTYNEAGNYSFVRIAGSSGDVFSIPDDTTMRILGSSFGGVDGVNDLTFTFSPSIWAGDFNSFNGITNITGTPISTVFMPFYGNFDFSTVVGTPCTFIVRLNSQAFISRLGGAQGFSLSLGSSDSEEFYGITVDGAGNSYACGYYWVNGGSGKSALVTSFDNEGVIRWSVYIDPDVNIGQTAYSIDISIDGNIFVTSNRNTVTKLNSANGDIIWQTYNSDISWDNNVYGASTPDGDYVISGINGNDSSLYIAKFSGTDGSVLLQKSITRANSNIYLQYQTDSQYISTSLEKISIAATYYDNNLNTQYGLAIEIPTDGNCNGTYGVYTISDASSTWDLQSTTSAPFSPVVNTGVINNTTASPSINDSILTFTTVAIGSVTPTAPSNLIENGTSWANIADADGNLVVSVAADNMSWTFATDRRIYGKPDQDLDIVAIDTANDGYQLRQTISDGTNDLSRTRLEEGSFRIDFDIQGAGSSWEFNSSQIQVPSSGGNFYSYDGNVALKSMNAGNNPAASLQSVSYINDPNVFTSIDATTTGANIRVYPTGSQSSSVLLWTFDSTGNVTLPDVASPSINYANGQPYGGGSSYGDSNVASFLAAFGSNSIVTTGSANVTDVNATGNVSAAGITTTGSQGNITGAFAIQAQYLYGDGSNITGLPAGYANSDVSNYLSSGNVSTNIITTANVSADSFITGNLTIQSNVITSAGDVITIDPYGNGVAGNVVIQGNLDVRGTTTTINSNTVSINDLVFNVANNASTSTQANGGGYAVGPTGAEYATLLYSSTSNSWNSSLALNVNGTLTANYLAGDGSNISNITGANVTGIVAQATQANTANSSTFASTANTANIAYSVAGANVTGIVAQATQANTANIAYSIDGANVSGQVGNALVAGTVYTNAQPNITSVGNLTGLTVDGNISANNITMVANVTASGNVTGAYFIGDGSKLTGIAPTVQVYEFANIVADVGGYYESVWLSDYVAGALTTVNTSLNTTPALMGAFITTPGYPNITVLPSGAIAVRLQTIKSTGPQGYYVYAEIFSRSAGGTETLLVTTDVSSTITQNSVVQQNLTAYITTPISLLSTDRIVVKVYGAMQSGSQTVSLQFDENSGSGLQLPALPASVATFIPYVGATANLNMGTYSVSTTGNVSANYFIGDGSQLTGLPSGNYGNANVASYLPVSGNAGNLVVYVDPVYGNDTYSGSELGPKQTIANAIATMAGQSGVIYLAPGTYSENWTYAGNTGVSFDGSGYGSQVNLTGNVVFAHTAGSCDLVGVNVANLTYSGSAGAELYLFQDYYTNINHTGAGELAIETCIQQGNGNITMSGGNVTINTSTVANLILNNANTVVDVYNSQGIPLSNTGWQLQSGSMLINGCNFKTEIGSNAITVTSAASPTPGVAPVLYLQNTAIVDTDGSGGNINIGTNAFWAVSSVSFDSASSTITSPYNLDTVFKFDSALFYRNITVGQASAPGATGNIVFYGALVQGSTANSSFTGNVSAARFTSAATTFTSSNIGTATISTLANVTATTAATSTVTGSLKTAGGLGVVGNAYVGGLLSVTGNATTGNISATNHTGTNVTVTGAITSSGKAASQGVGYATGAGNTVTQLTSKSTAVTLTGYTGRITANAAALGANTGVTFNMVNSVVGANDLIVVNHVSGGTFGNYLLQAQVSNAGNVGIQIYNATAGSLSDAVVIGFAVIKGATA